MTEAASAADMIASYVTAAPVSPSPAIGSAAARAFVDTYSACIAASHHELAEALTRYVLGHSGDVAGWSSLTRMSVEAAALVNGALAHVLDFDDVTFAGHPSCSILPAVVAVAEVADATGSQVCAAYEVGYEVMHRMARALTATMYERGWHSTSVIGVLGATAAVAHLLRLRRDCVAHSLGLAAAHAAGIQANFGSMAKAIQVGACAASAVRAALMAQAGITSSARALDAPRAGYVALYSDSNLNPVLGEELGNLGSAPTELARSSPEMKRYPMCYAAHASIDAVLKLRAGLDDIADVVRITAQVPPRVLTPLVHHRPASGLEAKFSMEYALAAAVLDGAVTLDSFDDGAVLRPQAQELLPRVSAVETADCPPGETAVVDLVLRDGRILREFSYDADASGPRGLDDGVLRKARDCFRFGHSPISGDEFVSLIREWNDIPVRRVLEEVRRNGARSPQMRLEGVKDTGTGNPVPGKGKLRVEDCMTMSATEVAIVGVGETDFAELYRRRGQHNDEYALAAAAVHEALDDAGLHKRDLDGLICARVGYQRLADVLGLRHPRVLYSLEGSGRMSGVAIQHAVAAVSLGHAEVVVCAYGNNGRTAKMRYGGEGGGPTAAYDTAYGMTSPGAYVAMMYRRYKWLYDAPDDALAPIAINNRHHASMNPMAVMQSEITIDDYLNSRFIAEPLRLLDYCIINDGGVAIIVTTAERARSLRKRPVRVLATASTADVSNFYASPDFFYDACQDVARRVYAQSGVRPHEIDCLQIYDNFTPTVLFTLEGFGHAARGTAWQWAREHTLGFDGDRPLNTSGGHTGESYMQGWALHVEAVRQIRGECGPRQVAGCDIAQYMCASPIVTSHVFAGE